MSFPLFGRPRRKNFSPSPSWPTQLLIFTKWDGNSRLGIEILVCLFQNLFLESILGDSLLSSDGIHEFLPILLNPEG